MGDPPTGSLPLGDYSNPPSDSRVNVSEPLNPGTSEETEGNKGLHRNSPLSTSQGGHASMQSFPSHQARQEHFNMTSLGTALPDISYQSYSNLPGHRYPSAPPHSPLLYQMQNVPQFTGSSAMSPPNTNLAYNFQYQNQYPGLYASGQTPPPPNLQAGMNATSQFYQGQGFIGHQQPGSNFFVQQGQYASQGQMYAGHTAAGQFGTRSSFTGDNRLVVQQRGNDFVAGGYSGGSAGRSGSIASSPSQSSVVRGPPRKPRQSGHAIWIGNLPPQTDLMSLVLHVCKETSGLESLFLISRSNCAFANFKSEELCSSAQAKIHDSRFQTVRLVSRLRRNSGVTAAGVSVPTGPAALTPPSTNPIVAHTPSPDSGTKNKEIVSQPEDARGLDDTSLPKDKFFIVKSLTVEDLELSVRNGIWATQSHNEDTLNKAYETAENVYLVFSANKSGEYFGYAKMISPINDDPAAAIEFAPKAHTVEDPEHPKAIPTPAREFVPKGRIIDDSARGTIFWEAEQDESDAVEEEDESRSNRSDQDPDEPSSPSKAWGKPFKIEWISTTRLPFYRTRGLRNPWNSNREVKIARDGTELETGVGRRLLALFHRLPSLVAPQMQGGPVPMAGGYPSMRGFP